MAVEVVERFEKNSSFYWFPRVAVPAGDAARTNEEEEVCPRVSDGGGIDEEVGLNELREVEVGECCLPRKRSQTRSFDKVGGREGGRKMS